MSLSQHWDGNGWLRFQHPKIRYFSTLSSLRVYPIKLMGDISDAGYFLSVLPILSGGPTHNYYLSLKSQHYKCPLQSIYWVVSNPQICEKEWIFCEHIWSSRRSTISQYLCNVSQLYIKSKDWIVIYAIEILFDFSKHQDGYIWTNLSSWQ